MRVSCVVIITETIYIHVFKKIEENKLKRISVILTLVLLMTLVIASPVFAGNGNGSGQSRGTGAGGSTQKSQQNFVMVGTITEVGSDSITIQTINARFAGQVETVTITAETRLYKWTETGKVAISFEEIAVGQTVNVKSKLTADGYLATTVTIDVPLYCQQ
jgi:hypothetical protein